MSDSPISAELGPFAEVARADVTLAPYTWLKVGGPAQYLVEPRSEQELADFVRFAGEGDMPVRVLGGGSNLLVGDEGVPGAVLKLSHDGFRQVDVDGTLVTAGAGALLSHVVSQSVAAGLAGLEMLVGIPGTVGGAIKGNAGSRSGEIGEVVESVDVLTAAGERFTRTEDELSFEYRSSSVNELVVLGASFRLREEPAGDIAARMKQQWITRKAEQPYGYQSAGCIFKNPRGLSAGKLLDEAGLKGTRVGGAEVSDRHANFIVTEDGAKASDVRQLIELMAARVKDAHGVELETEVVRW